MIFRYACIITDTDSIIVTGGEDNQGVARYDLKVGFDISELRNFNFISFIRPP